MGTAFILPLIGAALNYGNQKAANARGQESELQAINGQTNFRNKAMTDVSNTTNAIKNNNPNAIKNADSTSFVNSLRTNAAANSSPNGPTSALGPTPGASSRYGKDVASGTAANQSYGNAQAGEMSAVDAAVRQRQNEALAQQTLSTNLNTLGGASQSQNFVDQLRTQAASQVNPWGSMLANLASNAGKALALNYNPDLPPGSVPANSASGNLGG